MRVFAGILGVFVCCLALSTCGGTIRAIDNDYADDYIIREIKPTSGVSGEEVTFEAGVCTTAGGRVVYLDFKDQPQAAEGQPPQVIWHFGGGCDPDVSYEAKPTVNMRDGLRAPYQGTVTYRWGCGDGDVVTRNFTINVAPISALGVAPQAGVTGGTATFSVVGITGNIEYFAWDFGGAVRAGDNATPNPQVTFGDQSGIFNCRVVMGNAYEVYELPFTLSLVAAPE